MIDKFEFNELCYSWSADRHVNDHFIRLTIEMLGNKLLYKGYIYYNYIYEAFGAKWNPDDENKVIRYRDVRDRLFIAFHEKPDDENVFVIEIKPD